MSNEDITWKVYVCSRNSLGGLLFPMKGQIYIFFGKSTPENSFLTMVTPGVIYYTSEWLGGPDTWGVYKDKLL